MSDDTASNWTVLRQLHEDAYSAGESIPYGPYDFFRTNEHGLYRVYFKNSDAEPFMTIRVTACKSPFEITDALKRARQRSSGAEPPDADDVTDGWYA